MKPNDNKSLGGDAAHAARRESTIRSQTQLANLEMEEPDDVFVVGGPPLLHTSVRVTSHDVTRAQRTNTHPSTLHESMEK